MSSSLLAHSRRRPELNLVPLIDVLVMLIFFSFVTMQFKKASTLNIKLPKISTAGTNAFKNGVTISMDKEGVLAFNDKIVRDDQLEGFLIQVHNTGGGNTPILIRGDQDSQLKKLAFVMNACREAGLSDIHIQTQAP